jgi:hypothetical protein
MPGPKVLGSPSWACENSFDQAQPNCALLRSTEIHEPKQADALQYHRVHSSLTWLGLISS